MPECWCFGNRWQPSSSSPRASICTLRARRGEKKQLYTTVIGHLTQDNAPPGIGLADHPRFIISDRRLRVPSYCVMPAGARSPDHMSHFSRKIPVEVYKPAVLLRCRDRGRGSLSGLKGVPLDAQGDQFSFFGPAATQLDRAITIAPSLRPTRTLSSSKNYLNQSDHAPRIPNKTVWA